MQLVAVNVIDVFQSGCACHVARATHVFSHLLNLLKLFEQLVRLLASFENLVCCVSSDLLELLLAEQDEALKLNRLDIRKRYVGGGSDAVVVG